MIKSALSYFSVLLTLLALVACSGTEVLNNLVPHSGYTVQKDIAYGNNPRQMLDIYRPEGIKEPLDVIVFFHGGSWQKGSKDDYLFVGQALASKGYIAVIANYRLYPEVHFPAFMNDGARAFAWVHAHIADYGGNPDRLFLAGHSAGAYIAVMLTVNEHYLQAAHASRAWIKGTVGLAGPYDFLPFTDPAIKEIFRPTPDALTQPIHYVTSGLPPMLLLTGDEDTEVYPKNTYHLAARLREYHDSVTERTYPGVAHIGIVLALASGFRNKAPVLEDMDHFISGTRQTPLQ